MSRLQGHGFWSLCWFSLAFDSFVGPSAFPFFSQGSCCLVRFLCSALFLGGLCASFFIGSVLEHRLGPFGHDELVVLARRMNC